MMEETTPRKSAKWKPTSTFANAIGAGDYIEKPVVEDVEHRRSPA